MSGSALGASGSMGSGGSGRAWHPANARTTSPIRMARFTIAALYSVVTLAVKQATPRYGSTRTTVSRGSSSSRCARAAST